jgi:hypothetical protein
MKRNTIGENARQIVSGLSDLWRTNPWLSANRIGAHHGYRIDGAKQAQRSPAGAPQTQEHREKPTNDQLAALNTWEDEGGRAAASAKAVSIQ